jgi:MoaA/NifB/PqqE/SkfB family radical SAM enzyme
LANVWRTLNVIICRRLGLPPRYLPVILMFVTGQCNLRCRMCGVCDLEHGHTEGMELSTDEWKTIIHTAAKRLGTTLAVVSGGEALLREDVFELIRFATDSGIAIHLCTNAMLLNEENMVQLKNSGVRTVSISLEGPEAGAHEYLRGANSFPQVVNAIRKFREIAPEVCIGINYVITRLNYKNMTDMVAFAESLGVQQIKFAPIHTNLLHRRKKVEDYSDLLFLPEDLDDLEREVQRVRTACRNSALITTSDDFFNGITQLYGTPRRVRCYAGYAICAISPTGYVAPCSDMDSSFNVKEQSLDAIWRDPQFHALRKRVHACRSACWDTAYTELSLWLRPQAMVLGLLRNWKDVKFYFGGRHG